MGVIDRENQELQGQFEVNENIVIKIRNGEFYNFDDVVNYIIYDIERVKRSIVEVDSTQSSQAQQRWAHTNGVLAGRLKSGTAILGKIQNGDYHDMQHFEDKMVMMRNKKGEKLQKRKLQLRNKRLGIKPSKT